MADGVAELVRLASKLDGTAKDARRQQRAIHERLGGRLLSELRGSVASHVNDAHGHVAGWQGRFIGSGGGYAAVRPAAGLSGANSPGAITNYLENGHAVRRPGGRAKRYVPRIHTLYVFGNGFYAAYRSQLRGKLETEVRRWGDQVAGQLGG